MTLCFTCSGGREAEKNECTTKSNPRADAASSLAVQIKTAALSHSTSATHHHLSKTDKSKLPPTFLYANHAHPYHSKHSLLCFPGHPSPASLFPIVHTVVPLDEEGCTSGLLTVHLIQPSGRVWLSMGPA